MKIIQNSKKPMMIQSEVAGSSLVNKKEMFEQEFAAYCDTKYCIGVGNGLEALILILEGYKKIGFLAEGDEVIVPANTYIATILAISKANLTPVLVETRSFDL